jgi:hypothetical protein
MLLPDDGVTEVKHVGAVLMSILMWILIFLLKTTHLCVSWWINKTLIIEKNTALSVLINSKNYDFPSNNGKTKIRKILSVENRTWEWAESAELEDSWSINTVCSNNIQNNVILQI